MRRYREPCLVAVVTWGAVALAASAQTGDAQEAIESPEIEEVVVTASPVPRKRSNLTSSVSVIGEGEIELQKYDNVSELLRHVPGVHIEQPGSRGGRTSIYLRGLDPNHTVILVDGISMNDPNNNLGGSFDLSTLDTDNVERIEVVRGPLSAVHGSNALAGAINVITKTGKSGDELVVDVSGGRFGYHRELVVVRGQRGIFDVSLSGSFVDDGKAESDGTYRGAAVHSSFGAELPFDAELRGTLHFVDSKSRAFPEGSGGEKFALVRDRDRREAYELSGGLTYDQQLSDQLKYVVGVNYYRRREERRSPEIAPPPANPFGAIPKQRANDLLYRTRIHANGTLELIPSLSITAGGDVTFEHGSSVSDLDFTPFGGPVLSGSYSEDRVVGGPFLEGVFELAELLEKLQVRSALDLTVQAGVRIDFGNDTDTEWTPRVGASFRVPRVPVTFRGSWGQGFKLPAFFSLSDPLIGNRDLEAEKSVGWDVGADVVFWDRRVRLNVTYFEIRVKDLIDFDFASFRLLNRDRVSSKGVEIGFGADLPWNLSLSGSVTRARTKIRNSSARLRRRPGWRASSGLRWSPHERASVGLDALWVGSVHDESIPTGPVKLGDYVRFDARGEVRVWRDVSVYLAIDNLFDESYQEAVGVPAMGIRPRAGVRAVF